MSNLPPLKHIEEYNPVNNDLTPTFRSCRAMHKLLHIFKLSSHYPIRSKLTLIWMEHANRPAMDLYNNQYAEHKDET